MGDASSIDEHAHGLTAALLFAAGFLGIKSHRWGN
jgi:hypothetical protein